MLWHNEINLCCRLPSGNMKGRKLIKKENIYSSLVELKIMAMIVEIICFLSKRNLSYRWLLLAKNIRCNNGLPTKGKMLIDNILTSICPAEICEKAVCFNFSFISYIICSILIFDFFIIPDIFSGLRYNSDKIKRPIKGLDCNLKI